MIRNLLLAALAALVLAVPAGAKRVARSFTTVEKLGRSEVVVVGKVTAIEKETVNAARFVGDTQKVPHRVAVIKIDRPLFGSDGITHVKVGFVPQPPNADPVPGRPGRLVRGGFQTVELKEGQEALFFLTRHPGGEFYTITPATTPLDPKADGYKAQAEQLAKAVAALADPMKALKAEKAADRYLAAATLISRYRAFPEDGRETETAQVPADESKLILKALAEADWKKPEPDTVNPLQAFYQLGLNDEAGWKPPQNKPGVDFQDATKAAFVKWLDGAGKDYRIERVVPRKK